MRKALKHLFFLTAVSCFLAACNDNTNVSPANPTTGTGGSMARFAVSGDVLYTVDNTKLHLFDISTPAEPAKTKEVEVGFGVETIFPYQDKLFIGTQTGMYIMSIQNPQAPQHISSYMHVVSCDPVVTDGRYAYVTLRSGTNCRQTVDELHIVDLQNLASPTLLKQYPMTNPKGLGIDGNLLFVCDDGLKVYDATNVQSLVLKHHFKINAYDVIPNNGHLMVIGSDGLYQYQYTGAAITLLSKLDVQVAN